MLGVETVASSCISPDNRRCSISTKEPSPKDRWNCLITASISASDVAYSPKIHRADLWTFTDFMSGKDSSSF